MSRVLGVLLPLFGLMASCGTASVPQNDSPDRESAQMAVQSAAGSDSPPPTNVRFKGPRRLLTDLQVALGISHRELCLELGSLPCSEVHNITLGGVDAYRARIFDPPDELAVVSPIAVDRIVLSACGKRVERDFASPNDGLIFGAAATPSPPVGVREAVVDTLYARLLHRRSSSPERVAVARLYEEVDGSGVSRSRTWSQLACYAIGTSAEALFF